MMPPNTLFPNEVSINELERSCLWALSKNPIIAACIHYISSKIHANGMHFYFGCKFVGTTPNFKNVVDKYWIPASKQALHHIMVQGFFVWVPMVLKDGNVFPKILNPMSYNIKMRYSELSEAYKYRVFRTGLEKILNPSEEIEEDETREYIRIDCGLGIDKITGEDKLATVVDFVEFLPTKTGNLTSLLATLFEEITLTDTEKLNYSKQQTNIAHAVPFVEMPELNDSFVKNLFESNVAPATQDKAINDTFKGMSNANINAFLTLRARYIQYADQRGLDAVLNQTDEMIKGIIAKADQFKKQLSDGTNQQGNFWPAPYGSKVSPYKPSADSKHYNYIMDNFRKTCCNVFQLPVGLLDMTGKVQSATEFQRQEIDNIIMFWTRQLSTPFTEIYNIIYSQGDSDWFKKEIITKWLSSKILEVTKQKILGTYVDQKTLLSSATMKFESDHTVIETPDINGKRKRKNLTKNQNNHTISEIATVHEIPHNNMDSSTDEDDTSEDETERKSKKIRRSKNFYDKQMETESLKKAIDIVNALELATEDGGEDVFDKIESEDGLSTILIENIDQLKTLVQKESHVTVTYAQATPLTMAQLVTAYLYKIITRHEFITAVRAQSNLGVHPDMCDYDGVLNDCQEILGAIQTEKILQDTALAPLLTLQKQRIVKNEKEAVDKAVDKVVAEWERKMMLLKNTMKSTNDSNTSKKENTKEKKSKNSENKQDDKDVKEKKANKSDGLGSNETMSGRKKHSSKKGINIGKDKATDATEV